MRDEAALLFAFVILFVALAGQCAASGCASPPESPREPPCAVGDEGCPCWYPADADDTGCAPGLSCEVDGGACSVDGVLLVGVLDYERCACEDAGP